MDQLVWIWSNVKKMVVTRYFNSEFLGGAKAEKILQTFEKGINKLNPESFIQISSDGPNVNLRFGELFAEKRDSKELPLLIQIWISHTIHGSMKAGVKNSNWNIGKIFKDAWKLLRWSSCSKGAIWESNRHLHISSTLLWPSLVWKRGLSSGVDLKGVT